jgi:hypothetical protein
MNKIILQLNIIAIFLLSIFNVWYFQFFDNINWGIQIFILTFIIYFIEFIIILLNQYRGRNIILLSLISSIVYYFINAYLPPLRVGYAINLIFSILYLLVNIYLLYKTRHK